MIEFRLGTIDAIVQSETGFGYGPLTSDLQESRISD